MYGTRMANPKNGVTWKWIACAVFGVSATLGTGWALATSRTQADHATRITKVETEVELGMAHIKETLRRIESMTERHLVTHHARGTE